MVEVARPPGKEKGETSFLIRRTAQEYKRNSHDPQRRKFPAGETRPKLLWSGRERYGTLQSGLSIPGGEVGHEVTVSGNGPVHRGLRVVGRFSPGFDWGDQACAGPAGSRAVCSAHGGTILHRACRF